MGIICFKILSINIFLIIYKSNELFQEKIGKKVLKITYNNMSWILRLLFCGASFQYFI